MARSILLLDQKANTIYRSISPPRRCRAHHRPLPAGPSGLAIHPKSGQIIAVSWEKGKISEVSPDGVVTELFSNGFFSNRFQNLRGRLDRWATCTCPISQREKSGHELGQAFQVIRILPSPGDLGIDRANNLILVPYELAHAAEMNGSKPSSGKTKQEKRTLADYGFIPPPPKPAPEGP